MSNLGFMSFEQLFRLDTLPSMAQIEAQVEVPRVATEGPEAFTFVRFRASRRRWGIWRKSQWSGWFIYQGEPIDLTWSAFW